MSSLIKEKSQDSWSWFGRKVCEFGNKMVNSVCQSFEAVKSVPSILLGNYAKPEEESKDSSPSRKNGKRPRKMAFRQGVSQPVQETDSKSSSILVTNKAEIMNIKLKTLPPGTASSLTVTNSPLQCNLGIHCLFSKPKLLHKIFGILPEHATSRVRCKKCMKLYHRFCYGLSDDIHDHICCSKHKKSTSLTPKEEKENIILWTKLLSDFPSKQFVLFGRFLAIVDLNSLQPRRWLTSFTISYFLSCMTYDLIDLGIQCFPVWVVSEAKFPFFTMRETAKMWKNSNYFLFPFLYNDHFKLLICIRKQKDDWVCICMDSVKKSDYHVQGFALIIKSFIKMYTTVNEWVTINADVPQQENDHDCGIYTILNAAQVINKIKKKERLYPLEHFPPEMADQCRQIIKLGFYLRQRGKGEMFSPSTLRSLLSTNETKPTSNASALASNQLDTDDTPNSLSSMNESVEKLEEPDVILTQNPVSTKNKNPEGPLSSGYYSGTSEAAAFPLQEGNIEFNSIQTTFGVSEMGSLITQPQSDMESDEVPNKWLQC